MPCLQGSALRTICGAAIDSACYAVNITLSLTLWDKEAAVAAVLLRA